MNLLPLYLLIGKPSSGKGTQAALLAKHLGYETFSTGARFRELRERDDSLGRKLKEEYDRGTLMPYWFAFYVFADKVLNLPDNKGLVIEGPGRKEAEAHMFNDVLTYIGRPYTVIHLDVSDDMVMKRAAGRQRSDGLDNAQVVRERLVEYEKHTAPAIEFFRTLGVVVDVDGNGEPEEVENEIVSRISK